jgi:quercetin dioxygenase-like cupin family protein
MRIRWHKGVFRFRVGEKVWVRDHVHPKKKGLSASMGGFTIVQARVRERHHHPDRHPFYPNGEGYALDGELWWDCYPGCRVFATKEEAIKARMGEFKCK